jgi:hypothetical protein
MLISFLHTGLELGLWLLILRLVQIKMVKNNPDSGATAALSFVLGS